MTLEDAIALVNPPSAKRITQIVTREVESKSVLITEWDASYLEGLLARVKDVVIIYETRGDYGAHASTVLALSLDELKEYLK